MFIVPKGTEVSVVNFRRTVGVVTQVKTAEALIPKEAAFMLEDILVDPLGHVGIDHPDRSRVLDAGTGLGFKWAAAGLYGFSLLVGPGAGLGLKGEILLVRMDRVEVL
jgi:hypothetical protein